MFIEALSLRNYQLIICPIHSTTKSLSGKILGAIKVQMYNKVVPQDKHTLTQNPKPLDSSSPVIILAEPQFVISIPTYIDAKHI
jgi:hypothetical protein